MLADGSELDYEGAAKKIEGNGYLLDFGFALKGCSVEVLFDYLLKSLLR